MRTKLFLFALLLSTSGLAGCGQLPVAPPPLEQACPADARICPDGSGVGRKGPNCEFEECPTSANPTDSTSTSATTPLLTTQNTTMEFNAAIHYTATLHTDKGDIEVALNFGQTPNTVKNFVDLARKNFYDKTIFHRVIKGFMIQGGDPEGTGMGGPGYKFADEPFTGEYTRGTVAMANAGPNTNGSQFFIMHADYPLPKNYTIFGHVVKGLDVVDAIATSPVTYSDSGEQSKPVTPTVVKSVEVNEE